MTFPGIIWREFTIELSKSNLTVKIDVLTQQQNHRAFEMETADLKRVLQRPKKTGYLTKVGGRRKTWKKRYFILNPDTFVYYKSPSVRFHIVTTLNKICRTMKQLE
jgi:hypothetical protein